MPMFLPVVPGGVTAEKLSGGQGGAAPVFGARAWVNFNGTGSISIRGSGNVQYLVDNGPGDYTIQFSTPMQNSNYACVMAQGKSDGSNPPGNLSFGLRLQTVSSCRVNLRDADATQTDMQYVSAVIVG